MKQVLIVDDERAFILSLADGLARYADRFTVLVAENGRKAMSVLKDVPVDLVVTDLKMPVVDGFELLAYLSNQHPKVPVIVMTAMGSAETQAKLRNLRFTHYLEKPIDLEELARRILECLTEGSTGWLRGISLPAYLRLLELEQKSCILKIESGGKVGQLVFFKGELLEAEAGNHQGKPAVCEILGWTPYTLALESNLRRKKKASDTPLNPLLWEGSHLKKAEPAVEIQETEKGKDPLRADKEHATTQIIMEVKMALEKHLQALKEIKGFKAAGIMSFTGELLASESADSNINLSMVGATFNDIFRSAHEASKKIGLEACREAVISTPKGLIVMRCSGTDSKVHFHLIGIMAADGNQALMKMQIEKMVQPVMDELG